jgi:hypothetical protein
VKRLIGHVPGIHKVAGAKPDERGCHFRLLDLQVAQDITSESAITDRSIVRLRQEEEKARLEDPPADDFLVHGAEPAMRSIHHRSEHWGGGVLVQAGVSPVAIATQACQHAWCLVLGECSQTGEARTCPLRQDVLLGVGGSHLAHGTQAALLFGARCSAHTNVLMPRALPGHR